ncbi:MAG: hypothetical protein E7310_05190 [Clostridiales bacterium]|nr:hypothetical protein [Clostridiales bacterium]
MNKRKEFINWLDTFLEEKDIELQERFEINVDGVPNNFAYLNVIEQIKITSDEEQEKIREMIVKIDSQNGDVKDYFRHLAIPLAKQANERFYGITERTRIEEDIKELDLLYRKILDVEFEHMDILKTKANILGEMRDLVNTLLKQHNISKEEYLELIEENEQYKKLEKRKTRMAEDRYTMIWENCSSKEIAEILRDQYDYSDDEIINEFDDEETREEIKEFLEILREQEESGKEIELDNGYIFKFENDYTFFKLKECREYPGQFARIPEGTEIAIVTNSDMTREAFLVKYSPNIEIVYNFLNKSSNEMETYEYEVFDLEDINSKDELIELMKSKLEKFEEKYNNLEMKEEENCESI